MRKYLSFLLAITLAIFLFVPIGMASDTPSVEHYSVTNNTASDAHTHIAVTTIYPGKDRILGFMVAPVTSGAGSAGAGLYDAITDGTLSSANLLGEVMGVNTATHEKTFPAPISLENGLTVWQGAYTTVTIYYEITVGH